MELKNYQKRVISDLNRYCELLNETGSVSAAYKAFWAEKNVIVGLDRIPPYKNTVENTPHVCFKVPTGGGKTFLACNALKTIFDNLPEKKAKLVIWLVPSEAILSQTLETLSSPSHPYRQKIEADFNGRVQIYGKQQVLDGQQFDPTTVNEQLSIVVMSFDSFRSERKEGRKVYQENGNLQPFSKFISTPETLVKDVDDTALIQVFNQLSPVVIVDESHHTASKLSVEMLKNLNPCFILDLTATPRANSNIISYVDAAQLKAENMVKLPVIVYNRPSQEEVIADALDLRNKLEELATAQPDGNYIRPIVLFQAQPKQAENKETFERLKKRLVDSGISEEEIAIKTAEINELKNVKLQSPDCKIKYIITVNALKEGWDCPFAYILATLANKTSAVDVEQILGRILRLPYTKRNANPFLNLSYVITCSGDFHVTVTKIIQALNDAGFSEREYRLAEDKTEIRTAAPDSVRPQPEMVFEVKEEECGFNAEAVRTLMTGRREEQKSSSVETMLINAAASSDTYETAIRQNNSNPDRDLPAEVRSKVNTYPVNKQFKDEALALKIPQFFIKAKPNLFTETDPDYKELLTKEALSDGFTLRDKDTVIDFAAAQDNVAEVDVKANEKPKYQRLSAAENEYFKKLFQNLPPESRVKYCKAEIKGRLEKLDCVTGKDLSVYIDRIVGNMNGDELAAMEKSIHGYAQKIRTKIEELLDEYRRQRFYRLLETGEIECQPSFKLSGEIIPGNPFDLLSKSLYACEQAVNGFELSVIEKVSALSNVRWWHRNMERVEFCINGFLNHYPDFMIMTDKDRVVMLETKGDHLTSNDDSRAKAELGKKWQSCAGTRYRYYMVSSKPVAGNPDAVSLDEFMKIMAEL